MLIHVVADYGAGDLAFAEVAQRLALHLPGAMVVPTPVGPFDTLGAGFVVAQLALNPGPRDRLVFHNVAPRADTDAPRAGNAGEQLVAAWVPGDTLVVGPNAGGVLSFVAPEADVLRVVRLPGDGTQFRSRDFFPQLAAELVRGGQHSLGEPVDPGTIPAPPEAAVCYVDGYGNLKTSWSDPPAASGTTVRVTINGESSDAVVSDGTFEVPEGELSFAPGSTGWPTAAGSTLRFYELFLRGGSAAQRFGYPATGSAVELQ